MLSAVTVRFFAPTDLWCFTHFKAGQTQQREAMPLSATAACSTVQCERGEGEARPPAVLEDLLRFTAV